MDFIEGVILISEGFALKTWVWVVIGIVEAILIAVGVIEKVWNVFPSEDSFFNTMAVIAIVILIFFICACKKVIPNSYEGTGEYTVKVIEHLVDWDEFAEKYEILDCTDNIFKIKVKKETSE